MRIARPNGDFLLLGRSGDSAAGADAPPAASLHTASRR